MSRWLVMLVTVVMVALGLTTACGSDVRPTEELGTLTVSARLVTDGSALDPTTLVLRVHGTRTTPADGLRYDAIVDTSASPFTASLTGIPAGTWTFRAEADDDTSNTDPQHDPKDAIYQTLTPATGIVIDAVTSGTVALYLYDADGATHDFSNHQPRISSSSASATIVNPGQQVNLSATFADLDLPADFLTFAWTESGGSHATQTDDRSGAADGFSSSSVVWTAPATVGPYTVTLIATDAKGARAGIRFPISVSLGTATFSATFNAYPQVDPTSGLVASFGEELPGPVGVGRSVTLTLTATDPDNDALTAAWTSDCGNGSGDEFANAQTTVTDGTATATFSPTNIGGKSQCTIIVTVSDGTFTNTATLYLNTPTIQTER